MPQMNPPPVSSCLCHRTSGATIALGGRRGPGDESARPLCSRHFQRTDTTAPVSGRSEVDTQAPGRGWAVGPPRARVPKQGPSPRPGRRMAQEAFEAYGKSSPLPALPHHPFPSGLVPPPESMGTGGSRHGTLSTMRRCGDYRQGTTAAGDPGVRSLHHGEGREGPKEKPPPPAAAKCLTPCLRRACVVPATCVQRGDDDTGAPPHTPPPPRGCARRVGGATTGDTWQAPPPPCRGTSAAPRACAMLVSCLRRVCCGGKTTRATPPHTHTSAPPRVGDEGREGRTAPPPPRTKRQGGEAADRGCGTDHTTVS